MRRKVTAMVLVGGRGRRLGKITKQTAKPAVSFGAKYRLIDFVLSNLSNSDISTVGMITQYEPYDLMNYISIGSTWDLDVNSGGVNFLTPYTSVEGEVWQKGTAHAINQHYRFIEQNDPDYVLILSGDHIYKMNYNKLIDFHVKNDAEVTISTFKVTENKSRFGMLNTDETGRVTTFEEKPESTKSEQASMGIYVFNREGFKELLNQSEGLVDFGSDVIPLALKEKKRVFAYEFDGYFRDVGTIPSLFEANMELIDHPQFLKLHEYSDFPVFTRSTNLPPHHVVEGSAKKSLISDGVLIYGELYRCVVSSGCYIQQDTKLHNVILHEDVIIGKGSRIDNCIVVQNTVVPDNSELVFDEVTVIDQDYFNEEGDNDE